MKTIIISLLPALLTILMGNATIAGGDNYLPKYTTGYNPDLDSIVASNKPASKQSLNEDEGYVDDIPFDTQKISAGYFAASVPVIEPEQYADDIPFETFSIASRFLPASLFGIFPEPEPYINDIPFDTSKIACKYIGSLSGRFCIK